MTLHRKSAVITCGSRDIGAAIARHLAAEAADAAVGHSSYVQTAALITGQHITVDGGAAI